VKPPPSSTYTEPDLADKSADADGAVGWQSLVPGRLLTEAELASFAPLSRETADVVAQLWHVESETGRAISGSKRAGDFSGTVFPNYFPGESYPREFLHRLDHPELKYDKHGKAKETGKYRYPPGRGQILYFIRSTDLAWLEDPTIPILIVEGPKKALAAWQEIAWRGLDPATDRPRFLVIAVGGVWNWRGTVGRAPGPNGGRRPVKDVIPDFDRINFKGRKVIIAYDSDVSTNPNVLAGRNGLVRALTERGAEVGCLEWPPELGKGLDDYLLKVGAEKVLAELEKVQFGDWRNLLNRGENGGLSRTYRNVLLFLRHSPEWAGTVGYNEFAGTPVVLAPPPAPITTRVGAELDDNFDVGATVWFEERGLTVAPATVRSAMDFYARERSFHPVRDYLDSLVWDGVPRLDTWLIIYLNATAGDLTRDPNRNPVYYSDYLAAVGSMFLISAVARIYQPGAQVDHTIVLQGGQGVYKSSTLRTLAIKEDWFTDQIREFRSKDTEQKLRGIWVAELGDLAGLTNARVDMEDVKAFLVQRDGHFRLPYGHRPGRFPRSCVFAGTTNANEFLRDETGNRRFWCVRTGAINLPGLCAVVGQLYAEAAVRFRKGEKWWITDPGILKAAEEEQQDRAVRDVWHESVMKAAWLDYSALGEDGQRVGSTSVAAILAALNVAIERQDQAHKNRVVRVLVTEGWERFHAGPRKAREYRYRPGGQEDRS
jgi:predicted P-loop ATPase